MNRVNARLAAGVGVMENTTREITVMSGQGCLTVLFALLTGLGLGFGTGWRWERARAVEAGVASYEDVGGIKEFRYKRNEP